MRKRIWFILPIVSFIVFCSLCIFYDSKGYEYGLGCKFCDKSMPYNLVPIFYSDYPQRFYLKNEDDLELVGNGFRFYGSDFKIKNFLAYGYNETSVVLKCTDSLETINYLISYETKYKSKKGNPEISFKDLSNSDFEQVKVKYQWFEVDKEKGYAIDRYKVLSMLGALLSLIFIIRQIFKLRKAKATPRSA